MWAVGANGDRVCDADADAGAGAGARAGGRVGPREAGTLGISVGCLKSSREAKRKIIEHRHDCSPYGLLPTLQ